MVKNRQLDLDLLRIVAIMAVVVIHCLAWVQMKNPVDSHQWMIGNVLDSAMRWCVPIFVMISGSLLINDKAANEPSVFYKKRLIRIFVAILIWPLIYTAWPIIMFHGTLMPKKILFGYLSGTPVQVHLYFLFLIAGLYVLTPIISLLAQHSSKRTFTITTIAVLATTTVSHTVETFLPGHGVSLNFLTQCLPFAGYYMLGFAIKDWRVRRPIIPFVIFALSTGIISVLTYRLSHIFPVDGTGSFFYTYPSLFVMISSVSLFVFVRSIYDQVVKKIDDSIVAKASPYVLTLSGLTFGVFLIHILVLESFETFAHLNPAILKQSLLLIVLTITGSFAAVQIFTKIPGIRYLLR